MISRTGSKLVQTRLLLKNSRCSVQSVLSRSKSLLASHRDDSDDRKRRFNARIGLTGLVGLTGLAGLTCRRLSAEEEKDQESDILKTAGARIEGLPEYRCC